MQAAEFVGYSKDAILDAVEAEECRRSLRSFIKHGWHVVEPPSRPFVDNWHIGAVCEHLEAVSNNEIRRLLILIPPGQMKSLAVSVFWPAWEWGPRQRPYRRWIYTSYAQILSTRDSRRCRNLIRSPWYQKHWGDVFYMVDDQDTKTLYQTDATGFRLATSVDGVSTGERGDIIVADDPHKVKQVESETQRKEVIMWWDEAMQNRVNDPNDCGYVIVMQRVHGDDLASHVMSLGGFEVLRLPMEFEEEHRCYTTLKPKNPDEFISVSATPEKEEEDEVKYCWDPREDENELLFPKRYDREVLEEIYSNMTEYAVAAQYQMRPSPREGGLVKMAWFQRYSALPSQRRVIRILQSWDTANKGDQKNAYSVCTTWFETKTGIYLAHVYRERLNTPTLKRTVKSHAKAWKPHVLLIEDAASGSSLIQYLREETTLPVIGVTPHKDKVTRMDSETPTIEAGNVLLPEEADWLAAYETEMRTFPASKFMDQVDSTSQALKWIRENEYKGDWELV